MESVALFARKNKSPIGTAIIFSDGEKFVVKDRQVQEVKGEKHIENFRKDPEFYEVKKLKKRGK